MNPVFHPAHSGFAFPNRDQISGCLLGHSLADAIGSIFVGALRPIACQVSTQCIRPWLAGEHLRELPELLFLTDGAQLSWELVQQLTEHQTFNPDGFAKRISQQFSTGFINMRYWETHVTVKNYRSGKPWYEIGIDSTGCGSVHRSPAIGALLFPCTSQLQIVAEQQSWVTHHSRLANVSCGLVAQLIASALTGAAGPHTKDLPLQIPEEDGGLGKHLQQLPKMLEMGPDEAWEAIRTCEGFGPGEQEMPDQLVPALLWVLYCVIKSNWCYGEALQLAIRCGGQLVAPLAVVGALCGAVQGIQVIPDPLLERLTNRGVFNVADMIACCERCYEGTVRLAQTMRASDSSSYKPTGIE